MTEDKCATAHHEAGHAFADWHFGFRVKRASIIPNQTDNSLGHVQTKTGLHFRSLEYTNPSGARIGRLHERVVSILAGQAAQRRYRRSSVRSYHAASDQKAVEDILLAIHSTGEFPHVIRYLKAKAKNLIERQLHWFVIQHLAGELMRRKTMKGCEVEAAILKGFALHLSSRQDQRQKNPPKLEMRKHRE